MKSKKNLNDHVLVTGGVGYIGAHACKALARAGYTPITYDFPLPKIILKIPSTIIHRS